MKTLWMKMGEEDHLPSTLKPEEKETLKEIFNIEDLSSPWCQAAKRVGAQIPKKGKLLRWINSKPYSNWNLIVQSISHGTLEIVPKEKSYEVKKVWSLLKFFGLVKGQMKIEGFLNDVEKIDFETLPEDEQLILSLALGLVLGALTLRLPSQNPPDLSSWLSDPSKAPTLATPTIEKMNQVQKIRNLLGGVWKKLFPPRDEIEEETAANLIWEDSQGLLKEVDDQEPHRKTIDSQTWMGLGVHPGAIRARAAWIPSLQIHPDLSGPKKVYIFRTAHPDSTIYFKNAAAVLFAKGGLLSHACAIAREMGIPCVTGLGPAFIESLRDQLSERRDLEILVDGQTGSVKFL